MDKGINIEDVQVGLQLTKLKLIHAGWLVDFYNHMSTSKGKEIIESGWKAAGIYDAIKVGSENMPPIDPLKDIDPLLNENSEPNDNQHLLPVCDITVEEFELLCGYKIQRDDLESDEDSDSEWEEEENV